jgi:hypothetical protein
MVLRACLPVVRHGARYAYASMSRSCWHSLPAAQEWLLVDHVTQPLGELIVAAVPSAGSARKASLTAAASNLVRQKLRDSNSKPCKGACKAL